MISYSYSDVAHGYILDVTLELVQVISSIQFEQFPGEYEWSLLDDVSCSVKMEMLRL